MSDTDASLLRCARCAIAAEPAAFAARDGAGAAPGRDAGGEGGARECRPCRARRRRMRLRARSLALAVGAPLACALVAILLHVVGLATPGRVVAAAAWGLALLPVLSAVHEAGHVLAARLVGIPVHHVRLGSGHGFTRARWRSLRLSLHLVPASGATLTGHAPAPRPDLRRAAVALGGPLLHTLALVPAIALLESGARGWPALAAVGALWAGLPLLAVHLIPRAMGGAAARIPSDGAVLAECLTAARGGPAAAAVRARWAERDASIAAAIARADGHPAAALAAARHGRAQAPASVPLALLEATALADAGALEPACERLAHLLEREDPTDAEQLAARSHLAWCEALLEQEEHLDEAETLSREALEAAPDSPHVRTTRGAVLLARDHADEAREQLLLAYAHHERPRARARTACLLALAAARRHDLATTDTWRQLALADDPTCPLLARVDEARKAAAAAGDAAHSKARHARRRRGRRR